MSWKVYILRCGDDSLYTGVTRDLEKRIEQHRNGEGARYTRGRGPLELVFEESFPDRGSAQKREMEIKGMDRSSKLKLLR